MSKELRTSEVSVRASLDAEAQRASARATRTKTHAILSVVVTRRANVAKDGAVEVVVSAAVRDAKSGVLLGMIEGRAAAPRLGSPPADQPFG